MKQLIEKVFFHRELDINPRKVYLTFVMSTMSIGKSTLINALVGKDVLPSSNGAWTACSYAILYDDESSSDVTCVSYTND